MHHGCLIETNDFGDDIILESINKSKDAHPDTISVRVVWYELNTIILIFLKTKPMRYNLLRWTFSSQPGFTDTVPGTHKFPLHVRIRLFKAKWFVNTLRLLMFFFIYHLFIYAFMYARWSYRDGLLSSSHFAWSSIAQSICQRAFSLLEIWFQRPWFESCISQRKTTSLLSIRKSLACARASKLTTTNIYIHLFIRVCSINIVLCVFCLLCYDFITCIYVFDHWHASVCD